MVAISSAGPLTNTAPTSIIRIRVKTVITFFFDSGYVWGVSILLAFLLSSYTALPIVAVFGIVNAAELVKAGIGTVLVARGRWARRLDTGA